MNPCIPGRSPFSSLPAATFQSPGFFSSTPLIATRINARNSSQPGG
jgi:hypothetical protein